MHTGVLDWAGTEEADLQSILDEEDNVKTRIIFAREELKVLLLFALASLLVFINTPRCLDGIASESIVC